MAWTTGINKTAALARYFSKTKVRGQPRGQGVKLQENWPSGTNKFSRIKSIVGSRNELNVKLL